MALVRMKVACSWKLGMISRGSKQVRGGGVVCGLFVAPIEVHTMPVWIVNPY
jgi:hypothetical protein